MADKPIHPTSDGHGVSILIRSYGEESLPAIVASLECQSARDRIGDVVVVNGKAGWRPDPTLDEALRCLHGHVIDIAPDAFSYGRALNMGMAASHGGLVAILSGHSIPANGRWLEDLLACFEDPRVAGTCGGQLAYPDSDVLERAYRLLWYRFPRLARPLGVFNLSNAAIRRQAWEAQAFDERVAAFEDRLWAYQTLGRGQAITLSLHALTWHSHQSSVRGTALYLLRLGCEYARYFVRTRLGSRADAPDRSRHKVRHLP